MQNNMQNNISVEEIPMQQIPQMYPQVQQVQYAQVPPPQYGEYYPQQQQQQQQQQVPLIQPQVYYIPQQQFVQQPNEPVALQQAPKVHSPTKAATALVLGILSFLIFWPLCICGLSLASQARKKIKGDKLHPEYKQAELAFCLNLTSLVIGISVFTFVISYFGFYWLFSCLLSH